jgi:hypothetical protein
MAASLDGKAKPESRNEPAAFPGSKLRIFPSSPKAKFPGELAHENGLFSLVHILGEEPGACR